MVLTLLGGKARVAGLVWERIGDVRNYVEPFFGGGSVLLGRPSEPKIETVNDADGYIANFWRAVGADPDHVASFADWPVNEVDLHARHRWLVDTGRERVERLKSEPEYFDAKVAGWWVWGQCLWIGSGWCARPEWTGRESAARGPRGALLRVNPNGKPMGINAENFGKLPAIAGRDGGPGAYAKSRSRDPEREQRPHLASDGKGQGLIREAGELPAKLPLLGGDGKGVHGRGIAQKRPLLTGNNGGSVGVNATKLHEKRPALQQGGGGRGIARLAHQVPDLSGDSGAAGRGIHASGFLARSGGLQSYMRALSDRMRRVRVCCGDFERILGPAVTTCIGTTGVFLDPPYPEEGRAICYSHDGDGVWWRAYQWAIDNGENPDLRIVLCGYEHPDAVFPPGWSEVAWNASGGYGRSARGKANALKERIWFSPHCLRADQGSLFT